ncbi:hypothetical protein [Pelomonas sp. SE-A7]|uniref:hypothetical protein n=1 Tax=Pelomonas sp. SE-A7 TaxID=3054953 RepID=UPI00259CC5F4|nr:hypothetical protein [Pelomonas sp. SE-A7]MDM4766382.1 hypothetical protein [Pelomonas sp. SE-A7]
MNAAVKNAIESALIALVVAAACIWLLASGDDLSEFKTVMFGAGIAAAGVAHLFFMTQAIKQSGREPLRWVALMVLTMPIGSAIALAILVSEARKNGSAQQAG